MRGTRLLTESRFTRTESSQWELSRLSLESSSSMKSCGCIGYVNYSLLLKIICFDTSKLRLFRCCLGGTMDATVRVFFDYYLLVCEFEQSSAWRAYFAFDPLSLLSIDEVVSSELWLDNGFSPLCIPGSMMSKSPSLSFSWFKSIAIT